MYSEKSTACRKESQLAKVPPPLPQGCCLNKISVVQCTPAVTFTNLMRLPFLFLFVDMAMCVRDLQVISGGGMCMVDTSEIWYGMIDPIWVLSRCGSTRHVAEHHTSKS